MLDELEGRLLDEVVFGEGAHESITFRIMAKWRSRSSNGSPWREAQANTRTSPKGTLTPDWRQARAVFAASDQQASSKSSQWLTFRQPFRFSSSRLPLAPWWSSTHTGHVIAVRPARNNPASWAFNDSSPFLRATSTHTELSMRIREFTMRCPWPPSTQLPQGRPLRSRRWSRNPRCRSSQSDR